MVEMSIKFRCVFFVLLAILALSVVVSAVEPFAATLENTRNETAPAGTPDTHHAIAGNVSEINIYGHSKTQSWQGYFGNVTGTIYLADSSNNVMYNWSLASPEGEVYASTNNSIDWTYIQCFNFTADGTYADDTGQAGQTSLHGMNLTQIEALFGIADDDVDGVNETFTLLGTGHDEFYTANRQFSAGECRNTRIFDSTGKGVDNHFEEVLLYEPTTRSIVFTSILDEEDVAGFDGSYYDFEMLVLENGHGTDVSTTTYYFWVELE